MRHRLEQHLHLAAHPQVERAERLVQQKNRGPRTRDRANATRCCMPPLSWRGRVILLATQLDQVQEPGHILHTALLLSLRSRSPKATFSKTVRCGNSA
ncbi:hypothetical protein GS498_20785 [Rhodococcus hoagii]|nr:hypothetical protein [Prescottella equi]